MSYPEKFKWKKARTIQELQSILDEDPDLEECHKIDAVYIPPGLDPVTDEEDLNDNITEEESVGNLTGTFEIHMEEVGSSQPSTSQPPNKRMKDEFSPQWTRTPITYSPPPPTTENDDQLSIKRLHGGKTPLEIFLLFFDNEVMQKIVDLSLKYARDNNRSDFKLSIGQLRQFIGILILSGYHRLPSTDMYWSKDLDKGVDLVRGSMSRNTFRSIKRNLHLADNDDLDGNDKFGKVRPVYNLMNQRYRQFGVFTQSVVIDEQIVPYFDPKSDRTFVKGKLVRFGFKLWCLYSTDGYLYQFLPYQGSNEDERCKYSLGTKVVLELLSVVTNPSNHKLYFDNFFASYELFCILKEKNVRFTGSVSDHRLPNCPLERTKKKRGEFEAIYDTKSATTVVRWNDSSVITVATNHGAIYPLAYIKRYNTKTKKDEIIQQPKFIKDYHQNTSGVDNTGIYNIRVEGQKWWWPLFTNLLDCTIVNAWKIYNLANESKMPQLQFRSSLVLTLLRSVLTEGIGSAEEASVSTFWGRPSRNSLPSDVRFDSINHTIARQVDGRRRRCRVCRSHTIYLCIKCSVHLHPNCFAHFHTNQ